MSEDYRDHAGNPTATLAAVLERLSMLDGMPASRLRDLRSSVTTAARLLGRSPQDIVLDIPALRQGLRRVHPVQARISKKRLSNVLSDLRAALEAVGALPPDLPPMPLSEAWLAFLARGKTPQQVPFLGRLSRYCAATGRNPEDVNDATVAEFRDYLEARLVTSDPHQICRQSCYKFNAIVRANALAIPLLTTSKNVRRSRPLASYPETFQDDLARYLAWRVAAPGWEEDAPARAAAPATIASIKDRVKQALDAAITAGRPVEDFQSLADLANPDTVKMVMQTRRAWNAGQFKPSDHDLAATLLSIARHLPDTPDTEVDRMIRLTTRIRQASGAKGRAMGERSRKQLDQFLYNPENVERLLLLPERLMASVAAQPVTRQAALRVMHATAIAILLACPIRRKNLCHLKIGSSISPTDASASPRFMLELTEAEVKNRVEIKARLGSSTSRIIHRYITKYRKEISPTPNSYLFPAVSGGARNMGHFANSIARTIRDATGLDLSPHGFRHFAAFLYLQAHPGEYATVQKILGHRTLETTLKFYAPLTTASALERYGDLLEAHWGTST